MFKTYQLRRNHKWLALFAGWQLFIWALSGLYMTFVDLDIVHGDHLIKMPTDTPLKDKQGGESQIQPIDAHLFADLSPISEIRLTTYFDRRVYEVKSRGKWVFINAQTGQIIEALEKAAIIQRAQQIYTGKGQIESVNWLEQYPPELGGRKNPVWQVNFDDSFNPSLYFHPLSGRLISKRSDIWRIFDFFWVLHIMDYWGSNQFEGYLFRTLAILSLVLSLFGAGLLYFRLKKEAN